MVNSSRALRAPAAVSLASVKGGEPATELSLTRSYTTSGDATAAARNAWSVGRMPRSVVCPIQRPKDESVNVSRSSKEMGGTTV